MIPLKRIIVSGNMEMMLDIADENGKIMTTEEYLPSKLSTIISGLAPDIIKDLLELVEKIKK
jgi:hypothetical protein